MVRTASRIPVRQSFLGGTVLLAGGLVLVKGIGALFKIPLSAVIGEEGMGYFSTAYSYYNVLFSVAAVGLPAAVARVVSEHAVRRTPENAAVIRRTAVPLYLFAGFFGTALMTVLAPVYTRAVGNSGALPAMLALAPSACLCCLAAAYRGWHEGNCNMVPTTVSQVIEALGKLLFGLSGACLLMRGVFGTAFSAEMGAAAAVAGVSLGAVCSVLYLIFYRNGPAVQNTRIRFSRAAAGRLLRTAVPLSVGAAAASLTGLIDAAFLQTRIAEVLRKNPQPLLSMYAGGFSPERLQNPETLPNYLFGCYNMALTLFMLIPSVTQTVGISALPSVTRAYAGENRAAWMRSAETVLRITFLTAVPMGLGLSLLAGPIVRLIYGDRPSAPILTACLTVMGIAAVFAAVTTPLTSLLQATGHMELPVWFTVCGLFVKIVLNYVLAGVPRINILGGGISTGISYFLMSAASFAALFRLTGLRFSVRKVFLEPCAAALGSVSAAILTVRWLERTGFSNRLLAVPAILAAIFVYILLLVLTGALEGLHFREEKSIK